MLLTGQLVGCEKFRKESAQTVASASESAPGLPTRDPTIAMRTARLLELELRRDVQGVGPEFLASPHPEVRLRAARALARATSPDAFGSLSGLLRAAEPDVVGWAAYGIGMSCREGIDADRPLVARAMGLAVERVPLGLAQPSPWVEIPRAVGRCASPGAPVLLRDWLTSPKFDIQAVSLALGDLADKRGTLDISTARALLDIAGREEPSGRVAVYPLSRLPKIDAALSAPLVNLLRSALPTQNEERWFLLKVASRAVPDATVAQLLGKIAGNERSPFEQRVEALRSLGKQAGPGQRELGKFLAGLLKGEALTRGTGRDEPSLALVALEALGDRPTERAILTKLASLGSRERSLPVAVARRVVHLRCKAAEMLVGSRWSATPLAGCASVAAREAAIEGAAKIRAMGRSRWTTTTLTAWRRFATAEEHTLRVQAFEALRKHPEVAGQVRGDLVRALGSDAPGLVAVAAETLAETPTLARDSVKDGGEDDAIGARIVELLTLPLRDLETTTQVMRAAGALGLQPAIPPIESLCTERSEPPILAQAAASLERLTGSPRVCAGRLRAELPDEAKRLAKALHTITFQTDAGTLRVTLEPELAPTIVTRIVELARSGFYKGQVIHRVVPGFVTQIGSPMGDGYGGPFDRPSVPCETSPRTFGKLHVGVALAGRDTGSSQIFVTHAPTPHLDGKYAWIGTADGPWERAVVGDRIEEVLVVP